METKPLIYALVRDLFFGVKIEDVARVQGFQVVWAQPGDMPVERLVELQPALVLVDTAEATLPWDDWIAQIKTSPATRRIPVLAFGSHVDVATLDRAKRAGADEALARSRFVEALPELIQTHARVMSADEQAELANQCARPLTATAIHGLEQFNAGEYFECHETLEYEWKNEAGPVRDLYRAILQVAVAYYHITRGNAPGALKMFARAWQWFNRLPNTCQGVELAQLRADATAVEARVRELGPRRIGELDHSLLRPVVYQVKTE